MDRPPTLPAYIYIYTTTNATKYTSIYIYIYTHIYTYNNIHYALTCPKASTWISLWFNNISTALMSPFLEASSSRLSARYITINIVVDTYIHGIYSYFFHFSTYIFIQIHRYIYILPVHKLHP